MITKENKPPSLPPLDYHLEKITTSKKLPPLENFLL